MTKKQKFEDFEHVEYLDLIKDIYNFNDEESKKLTSTTDSEGNQLYSCKGDYIYEEIKLCLKKIKDIPHYYIKELLEYVDDPEKRDDLVYQYNSKKSTSCYSAAELLRAFPSDSKPLYRSFIWIILEKEPPLTEFIDSLKLIEKCIDESEENQIFKTYYEISKPPVENKNSYDYDIAKYSNILQASPEVKKEILTSLSTMLEKSSQISTMFMESNAILISVAEQNESKAK